MFLNFWQCICILFQQQSVILLSIFFAFHYMFLNFWQCICNLFQKQSVNCININLGGEKYHDLRPSD